MKKFLFVSGVLGALGVTIASFQGVPWATNQPVITPSRGATPGGSAGQVQYKVSASAFGGIPGSLWDGSTLTLPGVASSTPTFYGATALYVPFINSSKLLTTDTNGLKWDAGSACYTMGFNGACEGFLDYRINNPAPNQIRIANSNSAGQSRFLFYNDIGTNVYFGQIGSNIGNFFSDQAIMAASGNSAFIVAGGTHSLTSADFAIITPGKTLRLAGGSNAKRGTFTLSSGTAWVPNTSITANSVIMYTVKTVSGTRDGIDTSSTTVSTGFNPVGAATDNSTYNYAIIEGW